jgi:hypothetical protein
MSLFEPPAEPSKKPRAIAISIIVLAVAVVFLLYFSLRYLPEKRAAEHFFDALVTGDTAKAYQLWKPTASYGMRDFLADWGPDGYYGPVKSYEVVRADSPKNASGVLVTVAVSPFAPMPDKNDVDKSRRTHTVTLWIESKDKSFSFPP